MVPDYVSYIVGYRFWKLYKGALYSVYLDSGGPWPLRKLYRASVQAPFGNMGRVKYNSRYVVPGVHAFNSEAAITWPLEVWKRLDFTENPEHESYARPEAIVGGEVALWGEVTQYEFGYKASLAYPLNINHFFPYFPLRSADESMDLIRINYGIEVNVNESDWNRDQEVHSGALGVTGTTKT